MVNKPRAMKERIRRVQVLFKELGFLLTGGAEEEDGIFSGTFETGDGFEAGYLIDPECKFLEIWFAFGFTRELGGFVKGRLEEALAICYDYGCYISVEGSDVDFSFSVYSKLYYAGLNYYSLKETMYDFMDCVDDLKELLALDRPAGAEEAKETGE